MQATRDSRLERRRRALVEAARSLFIERGFERTTLADVVDRAGGSLSTLYKLFGNKGGLLAAVVQERVRSNEDMLAQIAESELQPAAALHKLGEQLGEQLFDPERIALSRIVIAYSLEDADFGAMFYRETLLRSKHTLTRLFELWRDRGIGIKGEPAMLAEVFLGVFVFEVHSEAISHGTISRTLTGKLKDKIDFFCQGAGLSC